MLISSGRRHVLSGKEPNLSTGNSEGSHELGRGREPGLTSGGI